METPKLPDYDTLAGAIRIEAVKETESLVADAKLVCKNQKLKPTEGLLITLMHALAEYRRLIEDQYFENLERSLQKEAATQTKNKTLSVSETE